MIVHPSRARAGSPKTFTTASRSILALAMILTALANITVALMNKPQKQVVVFTSIADLSLLGWGRDGAIVAAILLLLLARALARGKRHAWLLAVALLTFLLISAHAARYSVRYLQIELVALVILVALAPLFPTRSDPRTLRRGYLALALAVASFTTLRIILKVWDPEIGPFSDSMRHLLLTLLRGALFLFLTYGIVEILRPVIRVRRQRGEERQQAIALIQQYATRATDHFAAAPEISYFWSGSGQAFIAYRLIRGVALTLGDPVGPVNERAALLEDFSAYCRRQDWVNAVYLASPTYRRLCLDASLYAYKIGEEAVIETASFSTQGKAGAPVRHAMARARRDGVTVRIWQGEALPDDIFASMRRLSQAWLAARGSSLQMGFSMGRFPADWTPDLLTSAAIDASGQVCAFQTWTPLYAGGGWSLDNMRRTEHTPPGVMELLITETILWASARGAERMSLGLAPLAGLQRDETSGERDTDLTQLTRLERGAGFLHQRRLLLGDYASLYPFKAKFRPVWEARYLVVSDRAALPQTLSALMYAQGYRWWRVFRSA